MSSEDGDPASRLRPRPRDPRRIYIVGGPGAGKTTLARTLGDTLGLPVVNLDRDTAYRPPGVTPASPFHQWDRVPHAERLALVQKVADTDRWVVEGMYCGWTARFRDRADMVIYLDLYPPIAATRVIRRALKSRRKGEADWDLRSVRRIAARALYGYPRGQPATFAELAINDRSNSRDTTRAFLAERPDAVVTCRTGRAVSRLVEGMTSRVASTSRSAGES